MKKPKIKIVVVERTICGVRRGWDADIWLDDDCLASNFGLSTKKAAREWAKEWCRTVGAALMEKGK